MVPNPTLDNNDNAVPVIKGVAYCLSHVPDLVRHGSKPSRDIPLDPSILDLIHKHLRTFKDAVDYPPHQVFIGNLKPDDLKAVQKPWFKNHQGSGDRFGPFGEIMPEVEFYGWMKMSDQFDLMLLEEHFLTEARELMADHDLIYGRSEGEIV